MRPPQDKIDCVDNDKTECRGVDKDKVLIPRRGNASPNDAPHAVLMPLSRRDNAPYAVLMTPLTTVPAYAPLSPH